MKTCLLCPQDNKCRGYVLHKLVLKIHDCTARGENSAEAIAKSLGCEDMLILASIGQTANSTCWSKAYRMAVAHLLSELVAKHADEAKMRTALRRLVAHLDATFARLPSGMSVDPNDIIMDIYNMAAEEAKISGGASFIPAHVRTLLAKELTIAKQAKVV